MSERETIHTDPSMRARGSAETTWVPHVPPSLYAAIYLPACFTDRFSFGSPWTPPIRPQFIAPVRRFEC